MTARAYFDNDDDQDRDHLRILSICYYVFSGVSACCALAPSFHLAIGIAIVTGKLPNNAPPVIGWIFVVVAGSLILFGWAYSIGMLVAARMIRQRKRYVFCLVMGGLACLQQPLGLALGIFTFIVLSRRSVKRSFDRKPFPSRPSRIRSV